MKGAYLHYNKPGEKLLRSLTLKQADRYLQEGHFAEGSMQPKIEAATQFLKCRGKRAVIASITDIETAVLRKAGTEIIVNRS